MNFGKKVTTLSHNYIQSALELRAKLELMAELDNRRWDESEERSQSQIKLETIQIIVRIWSKNMKYVTAWIELLTFMYKIWY